MFRCAKCGSEVEAGASQCPSCGHEQPERYTIFKKPEKEAHLFKIVDTSEKRAVTTYRSDGLTVLKGINPEDKAWINKKGMVLFPAYNITFADKSVLIKQKMRGYEIGWEGMTVKEMKYNWEYVFKDKQGETVMTLKRRPVGFIFDIEMKEYDFVLLCIITVIIYCIFNGENYQSMSRF